MKKKKRNLELGAVQSLFFTINSASSIFYSMLVNSTRRQVDKEKEIERVREERWEKRCTPKLEV